MEKRIVAILLLMVVMVVGCGKVDEKTPSGTSDKKEKIAVETEVTEEMDTLSQEVDESLYLLKNEDMAKDVTQQAFANIYKKSKEIDEKSIQGQLLIEAKRLAKNQETKEERQ